MRNKIRKIIDGVLGIWHCLIIFSTLKKYISTNIFILGTTARLFVYAYWQQICCSVDKIMMWIANITNECMLSIMLEENKRDRSPYCVSMCENESLQNLLRIAKFSRIHISIEMQIKIVIQTNCNVNANRQIKKSATFCHFSTYKFSVNVARDKLLHILLFSRPPFALRLMNALESGGEKLASTKNEFHHVCGNVEQRECKTHIYPFDNKTTDIYWKC